MILTFCNLFQKEEIKGIIPHSLYEANLVSKSDTDITWKENYRSVSLMDTKIFSKTQIVFDTKVNPNDVYQY